MKIQEIVWLMPLLFILHDMEEIIFAVAWKKKEPRMKRYINTKFTPFGTAKDTPGFALAVYEELLVLCISSLIGVLCGRYELWLGLLGANIIHIVWLHVILMPIMYHSYVPGVVTAVLSLPACVWMFIKAIQIQEYSWMQIIVYVLLGVFVSFANLKILHKRIATFGTWIQKRFE